MMAFWVGASCRAFKVMRRVVVSGRGWVCGLHNLGKEWSGVEWCCGERRRSKSERTSAEIWKEEFKKGYFDDFGQFKEHKGKLFEAKTELMPVETSVAFPATQFVKPDSSFVEFPEKREDTAVPSFVCVSFREGARDMVVEWVKAFRAISSLENCFKIHVIEHRLMWLWPFRNVILASGKKDSESTCLFHFGDYRNLCEELEMTNKLTAYVYLLDMQNRIRWRASGMPKDEEIQYLKHCYSVLKSS